jgi:ABC-type branched-subunit amino acid transport system substrate-binding protein
MKNWCRQLLFPVLFCILPFALFISCVAQDYTLSKKDTSDIQFLDGKKYYVIKVDKSETLYGISKRFNVSQDELIKANPSLKDGLKAKMVLWIPAQVSATKKSSVKKEEAEKEKVVISKQRYNVALFMPLNLSNVNYDYVPNDTAQSNVIDKEFLSALEFYEGIQHAVDTLTSKDCSIHLSVYDTGNDSITTASLLKKYELKETDFIISENNNTLLKQINHYSTENHIPLFTYSQNSAEAIKQNPMAYALQPSSNLQCKEGGKFAAVQFKTANVIAVKTSSKENERALAFQSGWNEILPDSKLRIIDYSMLDSNVVLKALVKGKNNVVFVSSSNEDVVNPLLLTLMRHKDNYEMTVIGLPTWQYFESIDMEILETLNTHIFNFSRLNNSELPGFSRFFRNEYLTEPRDEALQGYDLMMLIGKNFMGKKQPENKNYNGIFTNYTFPESKGVHENNFITVMKYKDYDLVEVK